MSGYRQALEAAGAEVLAFEQFGSYQGTWWAKVRHCGAVFWVSGEYGSCSHCDAFESEFSGSYSDLKEEAERMAAFGRQYLEDGRTQEGAEEEAGRNIEWDADALGMLAWIKSNAISS